ncbi:1-deoxy-D-xylulose-5-phosphate synthase [Streptomyces monticola]|uniref:1-deoxy-D-xylulose-5-phosphate synthase n=1 Tax=Streptomyces monticola TaxID=2666263 RepID=A0ABW2JNW7_9ACTN
MGVLETITGPNDLRMLDTARLPQLAEEIRHFLITKVARTGGHLGPNLGVVELTIALHRVFAAPQDRILWDTGHQAYVHKMLTGRIAGFDRLRRRGGLSGYPSSAESAYDLIENSHASTALSYADGLAKAERLRGRHGRAVVAVVGDGALTGGMAWEALNNIAAAPDRPVIVVLNDNGRSYAPTSGAIAQRLALRPAAGGFFAGLGLSYIGPVDGHDIAALEAALREAAGLGCPVVVHCLTQKGRGYRPAELDGTDRFHTVRPLDPATGRPLHTTGRSWTSVFGEELVELGAERTDIVALTAAMLDPTGLGAFAAKFPDRVFDVGIAEQHAVASAAGLALGGLHPVVALYATFLNRAFDQLLMDTALHRCPVTFVLDRAGVTGEDGPSHNGMWDLSVLQVVPGLRIAAPRDARTLKDRLREAVAVTDGPTVVRFPKGDAGPDIPAAATTDGLAVLRRTGAEDVLIVSVGAMARPCLEAAGQLADHGKGVTVVDPQWVKPVSAALIALAARHRLVVTVEDGCRAGGAGSALADEMRTADVWTPVRTLGIPPRFLPHGKRAEVLLECGLSAADIVRSATEPVVRPLPAMVG